MARRYAAALADVALERGVAEKVRKDFAAFLDCYRGAADLRNFLASPAVPKLAKQGAVEKLGARLGIGLEMRNFLFLTIDHRRTENLGEIREAFETELHTRMGVAEAEVTSARELSAEEKRGLNGALERLTGKKIESRYQLDSGLIGGAVVRIGSTIYDGSVKQQLEHLRAELESE
ncbi:MAG: ATP synthase F1 subunit delta [Candidatus Acidiferrales bacterium]